MVVDLSKIISALTKDQNDVALSSLTEIFETQKIREFSCRAMLTHWMCDGILGERIKVKKADVVSSEVYYTLTIVLTFVVLLYLYELLFSYNLW